MTSNHPQPSLSSISQKGVAQIAGAPNDALSSTTSTTGAMQQFYKPRARANSGGTRRTRTESLTTSPTGLPIPLPGGSASVSRSPSFTKASPVGNAPSPIHSSTHTGNILPPAAFYRPSHPAGSASRGEHAPSPLVISQPPLSPTTKVSPTRTSTARPSSGVSAASSLGVPLIPSTSVHAREHGLMLLQPLSHVHTRGSDGSGSGNDSTPETKKHFHTRSTTTPGTRVKPSREQLLPIREKDNSPMSQGKVSPSLNGVRESLERMFRRTTSSERDRERSYDDNFRLPTTMEDDRQMRVAQATSASPHHAAFAHRRNGSSTNNAVASTSPKVPTHTTYIAPRPPATTVPVQQKRYGPERNWQMFPSRNTFFCQGRLLTGGDSPWAFLFSLSLVFGIAGVWFGTTCVWWWKQVSPAVAAVGIYMCLLTITSMMATALRDPGILPRNLDPDPPYEADSPSDGGPRAPLPRDLRVRSGAVRVKYCTTCLTYRPPRSSHCKLCDNCVEGCDHHCPWVNNCIGRRNYTSFFTFLLAANLTLLLVIITSAIHLWLLIHRKFVTNFVSALKTAPGSATAFCLSIVVIGPVAALFFYHVRLMLLNITTIEQVRNQAHRSIIPGPLPPNAFTLGKWYRNLAYLMCRPVTHSWIDGEAYVMHDQRLPNPGYGLSWKDDDLDVDEVRQSGTRESTWQESQHH